MTLDLKRLIAVLGRLGSDAEAEVIMAGRLATKMLRDANKTWEQLLAAKPPPMGMPVRESYRTPPSKRKAGAAKYGQAAPRRKHDPDRGRNIGDDIQEMLSALSARRMDMSTMMFIAGLNNHWEKKSYLTDPQYEALKRIHGGREL